MKKQKTSDIRQIVMWLALGMMMLVPPACVPPDGTPGTPGDPGDGSNGDSDNGSNGDTGNGSDGGTTTAFTVEAPVQQEIPGYGDQFYAWELTATNHIQITVRFSDAVDMTSLIAQTNVVLETTENSNAPITITAGATTDEIVITSQDTVFNLTRVQTDLEAIFSLTLRGSGSNPITSSGSVTLDGDDDGTAGGDFEADFIVF